MVEVCVEKRERQDIQESSRASGPQSKGPVQSMQQGCVDQLDDKKHRSEASQHQQTGFRPCRSCCAVRSAVVNVSHAGSVDHYGLETFGPEGAQHLLAMFVALGLEVHGDGDIAHADGTAYPGVVKASDVGVVLGNDPGNSGQ